MNNLAQLFQVAPITAAGFSGQQFASDQAKAGLDQQKTLADITKLQQDMEHASQMNPLRVQQLGLQNDTSRLTNRKTGLEVDEFSQTMPGRVASTNAKNANEADDAKYKQIQRMQGVVDEAAVRFGGIKDPLQRTIAMSEYFKAHGVPPDNPIVQRGLTDPNALMASSQKMKKWLIDNNPAYRQAVDVATIQGDKARDVANISANASRDVANTYANARMKNAGGGADFWGTFYTKLKTARDKHAALVSEAAKIESERPEEAAKMRAIAESIRPQAEAEIKSANPGGINAGAVAGLPTNPGPQIAPPQPQAPSPQPGAPQSGGPQQDLRKAVEAKGEPFRPDLYDYRVGPTGQVQKKPKQAIQRSN